MDVGAKIDARIAKLEQAKKFLSDPEMYALVKELIGDEAAVQGDTRQPKRLPHKRRKNREKKTPRPMGLLGMRGSMAMTAYDCVQHMDEPFTRQQLVERVKAAGYRFLGKPTVSIQSALQKLLYKKIIFVVEKGAGRRPTVYQRKV